MGTRLRTSAGFLIAFFLALFAAAPSFAQFTLVSGTVTDTNGLAYACATISAQIVNANGQTLYLNGQIFSSQPSATKLGCPTDPSTSRTAGAYTVSLADNTQIKCGNSAGQIVTCATQTTWNFTVNTTGTPPPLGTGPQTCQLTAQTISGASQTLNLTSCPALSNSTGGSSNNSINLSASKYGYTPDVQIAVGKIATINVTGAQNTFTCTGFGCPTASAIGKSIFGTAGCCINTLYGTLLTIGSISVLPTITNVAGSTVTLSANAANSCTTSCIIAYGTAPSVNDAALASALTDLNALTICGTLRIPMGWAFVSQPFLNTTGSNCNALAGNFTNIGTGLLEYAGGAVIGEGNAQSMFIPVPTFNFSGCPAGGCIGGDGNNPTTFWAYWGVNGLHQSLTGGNHAVNLVAVGNNSKWINMEFTLWGDADASALGAQFGGGLIFSSVLDSWGGGGGTLVTQALSWIYQSFIGEANGVSWKPSGGPSYTYGNYFGQTNSGSPIVQYSVTGLANAWYSTDDFIYGNIAANSNIQTAVGGFAYFDGLQDVNNGVGAFNGLYCPGTCYLHQSSIQGGSTGSTLVTNGGAAGGTIFNDGTNTLPGTISSTVIPTWASTGTGTTPCTPTSDTLSFNEGGTFTCTAAAGAVATGTFTMTFAGTFAVNGQPPACNLTLKNGTGTWAATAAAQEDATTSTTSYKWDWSNGGTNLTATSTYKGAWICRPR